MDEMPEDQLRPGQVVAHGRYTLLDELGRGGLATVFRARDKEDGSEVALKVLCDRYVGRPEREERLLREFEYAQRVVHPAVVEVFEDGRLEDGRPFFTMELVEGTSLSRVISDAHGLPYERARQFARAIAVALDAVHEAGVVHRDVKPDNILVLEGDGIKLIDFGMAGDDDAPAVPAGHAWRLTRVNDLLGTAGYIAPEQVLKAPPQRSMDVFSLGVVMYEMLSRMTPYAGMRMREYVELQRAGDPARRSVERWARLRGAPEAFVELVDACRQRDPGERPATMREVIEQLDAMARPVERPSLVVSDVPDAVERSRTGVHGEGRQRSWMVTVWAGAFAAGLALFWGWPTSELREVEESAVERGAGVLDVEREVPVVAVVPPLPVSPPPQGAVEHPVVVPSQPAPPADRPPRQEAPVRARGKPVPGPEVDRCPEDVRAAHRAATAGQWTRVLRLTKDVRCWGTDAVDERIKLRTWALYETERYAECAKAGRGSDDPNVARWTSICEQRAREDGEAQ